MSNSSPISSMESLLEKFNKREPSAFGDVYIIVFDEINNFACHLFYATNVDVRDLIQDLFLTIWSKHSLTFISIVHLKNYLYLAVKNKFRDHLKHNRHVSDYQSKVLSDEDYLLSCSIESSVLNTLNEAVEALPERCAEVFRLYLDGWNSNEIVLKTGKSRTMVYDLRTEAIEILKKNLKNTQFLTLTNFL